MLDIHMVPMVFNRTITDGSTASGGGGMNMFNLIFVVGFALIISALARYLALRGRRK